eukprot:m.86054 g.86054  ORF g.86054 m.86054 type:complete len:571 (-) comp25922_c0_seq1:158-1870(-)
MKNLNLLLALVALQGTNGLVAKPKTPIMGFSTWNCFASTFDESTLAAAAQAMFDKKLVSAGYTYFNIDDAWGENDRSPTTGAIVESHVKFPSGMKAFANHLKTLGLNLGLYTARSNRTCGGKMPGSLGHELIDAKAFTAMGATFIKNDDCRVIYADAAKDYGAMETAIAAIPDVEIIHNVKAPDLGPADAARVCQFRRVGKDLKDDWEDVVRLIDTANSEPFLSIVGEGFFSDLDMLEVGNPGNCKQDFPGQKCSSLSYDEQITHFSMWAAFKSPLVIGADPRSLDDTTVSILTNEEVIAVNQDTVASPVRLLSAMPGSSPVTPQEMGAAGIKTKMAKCDSARAQQHFTSVPVAGSTNKVKIMTSSPYASCATLLSSRWPWWVSLLPCNDTDDRQVWQLEQVDGGLLVISTASKDPWPSKCVNGTCPSRGCLEVEGSNAEVDQCNWSTNSTQFVWEWGSNSQMTSDSQHPLVRTGALMNKMSRMCLESAAELEVYGGPLSGGKHTAVLFNRGPTNTSITLDFGLLGLSRTQSFTVRDIVEHKDLGTFASSYTTVVRSHAVAHLVVAPMST